jgi:hypothetical protein
VSDDLRNDGLHPRHPGRGKPASVIAAEADDAEVGGFYAFFPSGATKVVSWRQLQAITPTLDAAKQFTVKVVEQLQRDQLNDDINGTNWASFVAAVQRVILDWNDKLAERIGAKMAKEFRMANGMPISAVKNPRLH